MAGAVAAIDVLYATLGLAGARKLAELDAVVFALGIASAAILVTIGARTIRIGFRRPCWRSCAGTSARGSSRPSMSAPVPGWSPAAASSDTARSSIAERR